MDDELGQSLLILARQAIGEKFGISPNFPVDRKDWHEPGATFVTLTQRDQLRGCIGTLEAWRPLCDDVRENACHAAFRDPRFKPLSEAEFPGTRVEVSLLSAPAPLSFLSEADALAQLQPEMDGLIFSAGGHRATFLPQVWEQLPDPAEFMARLKQKAGLPASYWGPDVRLQRYTVQKWKEATP